LETSKDLKLWSDPIVEGIVPTKLFPLILKLVKLDQLPIVEGIDPDKQFEVRVKDFTLIKFPMVDGNVPPTNRLCILRDVNIDSCPMDDESVPIGTYLRSIEILITRLEKQVTPTQFVVDPTHTKLEQFQLAAVAKTDPNPRDKSHIFRSSLYFELESIEEEAVKMTGQKSRKKNMIVIFTQYTRQFTNCCLDGHGHSELL